MFVICELSPCLSQIGGESSCLASAQCKDASLLWCWRIEEFVDEMVRDVRWGLDYTTELIWNYRMDALLFVTYGTGLVLRGIVLVGAVNALRGMPSYGFSFSFSF